MQINRVLLIFIKVLKQRIIRKKNKMNNDYDLSDIMEKIVFHHDCEEDEILQMVKNAKFDLSELDEEGRNIADMAEEQNFMKVVKFLRDKGIKNTWEGTEFEVKSSSTDNK